MYTGWMYSTVQSAASARGPVPIIADPAWVQSVLNTVQAGFPSPAEDHALERVDLNKVLIRHPEATFLMRVRGPSMREAGIDDGDVVLVDRAIRASHGHVVVAVVDGEFTVTLGGAKIPFILRNNRADPDIKQMTQDFQRVLKASQIG